jgi:GNAT superfamily N-acetyltransferase
MLLRCTVLTLRRRFHGVVDGFPEPYLTDTLVGRSGRVGLIHEEAGEVNALASYVPVATQVADLAILVEDSEQGRGLGTALLDRLVTIAASRGFRTLTTSFLVEQVWIVPMLRPYGLRETVLGCGVVEASVAPVGGRPSPADGNRLREWMSSRALGGRGSAVATRMAGARSHG